MLSGREDANAHLGRSGSFEAQKLRRSPRHVDDTAAHIGAAVIDAQLERAPVFEIGHLDDARHRQGAMRGRQSR